MTGLRTIEGGGRPKPGFHSRALVLMEAGRQPQRIETAPHGMTMKPCKATRARKPPPPEPTLNITGYRGTVYVTVSRAGRCMTRAMTIDEADMAAVRLTKAISAAEAAP
jgi:hypothetical protein